MPGCCIIAHHGFAHHGRVLRQYAPPPKHLDTPFADSYTCLGKKLYTCFLGIVGEGPRETPASSLAKKLRLSTYLIDHKLLMNTLQHQEKGPCEESSGRQIKTKTGRAAGIAPQRGHRAAVEAVIVLNRWQWTKGKDIAARRTA
jgi:hypothetical protein